MSILSIEGNVCVQQCIPACAIVHVRC